MEVVETYKEQCIMKTCPCNTPLLKSKTGVYTGKHYSLIFALEGPQGFWGSGEKGYLFSGEHC